MGYTPGPWRLGHLLVAPDIELSVHDSEGWSIADCNARVRPTEENMANARLIARAPELLEALKRAEQIIRNLVDGFQLHSECSRVNLKNELMNIQEDIAKAEGRGP